MMSNCSRNPVSSPVPNYRDPMPHVSPSGRGDPETPRVCSPEDGNGSVDSFEFDSSVDWDDLWASAPGFFPDGPTHTEAGWAK